jgi:hypothetical protein
VTKVHLQRAGLVMRAAKRSAHRKKRPRRPMVGMMLHQDGSTHAWLPGVDRQELRRVIYDEHGHMGLRAREPVAQPIPTSAPEAQRRQVPVLFCDLIRVGVELTFYLHRARSVAGASRRRGMHSSRRRAPGCRAIRG